MNGGVFSHGQTHHMREKNLILRLLFKFLIDARTVLLGAERRRLLPCAPLPRVQHQSRVGYKAGAFCAGGETTQTTGIRTASRVPCPFWCTKKSPKNCSENTCSEWCSSSTLETLFLRRAQSMWDAVRKIRDAGEGPRGVCADQTLERSGSFCSPLKYLVQVCRHPHRTKYRAT